MKLIGTFAGAALTAALAIGAPAEAQVVTLRIESIASANHPTSLSMQIFKDEVERLSRGAMEIEVVTDSPRGATDEMIDAVHADNVFATWLSVSRFSSLIPETAVVEVPFIFENHDEARRAIIAGPVGSLIAAKFEAKGFTVLTWLDGSAFNISNARRPLKTLDDFKGLALRVVANPVHQATFQALGVRTVAIDPKDVDAALRKKKVDGAEEEYAVMYASKYFENQKYLAHTAHFLDFYVLVANKNALARLEPRQQQVLWEAAEIASRQERKISAEAQATMLSRLQDAGMRLDPLPAETRAALRRATARVVDDVSKSIGADVLNRPLAVNRLAAPEGVRR